LLKLKEFSFPEFTPPPLFTLPFPILRRKSPSMVLIIVNMQNCKILSGGNLLEYLDTLSPEGGNIE